MSDRTDLVRLQRHLAEERNHLRIAVLMVAYSTAWLVLGLALAAELFVGTVLLVLAICGVAGGTGWAIWYGTRVAKLSRQLRTLTRLPAARVIQR